MSRILILFLLTAALAWPEGVTHVVLIGIENYRNQLKLQIAKFASRDAKDLSQLDTLRGKLSRPGPLTDGVATQARIQETLRQVLTRDVTSSLDTVLLFVSGRGLAIRAKNTNVLAGALLAHESEPERLNTGVTVDMLDELIGKSAAGHIILAVDVLRDPGEKLAARNPNEINFQLADLAEKHTKLDVILASQRSEPSRGLEVNGHSIFVDSLIKGLTGGVPPTNGSVTVSALVRYVQEQVKAGTQQRQTPFFRAKKNKRDPVVIRSASPRRRDRPILVASAGGFDPNWLNQYPQPGGNQRRDLTMSDSRDLEWSTAAVQSEEQGQRVLVRYGESDYLPQDWQVRRREFGQCRDAFAKAIGLRRSRLGQKDETEEAALANLEARRSFCEGRDLLSGVLDTQHSTPGDAKLISQALPALERSIQLDSRAPEARNAKGVALYLQGPAQNLDESIRELETAVALAPNWAYARHNLALAAIARGDFERAIAEYRRAIQRTPDHAYLHYNLAVLLHRLNRKDEARDAYRHAIAKFRQIGEDSGRAAVLQLNQAAAHNALGALLGSEAEVQTALSLNPGLASAHYNLGVLRMKKAPDVAAASFETALKLDSAHTPARQKLAECYQLRRQYDQALAQLEKLDQDSAFIKMATAEVQGDKALDASRKSEACAYYQSSAQQAPPESPYRRTISKKLRTAGCPTERRSQPTSPL